MANTKISARTAGSPAQYTDQLPIARAGANFSLQVSDILSNVTYFNDDFMGFGPNVTVSGTGNSPSSGGVWGTAPITGGTTGTIQNTTGTFQNPGQITLTTNAVSGNGVCMWAPQQGAASLGILGSNAGWQADFWIQTLSPSATTYNQRFYLMDIANDIPSLCRHTQIRWDWPAENAANEILAMTLFGGIAVET
jgi:hypothetical protein